MNLRTITCTFKGHLWLIEGETPNPNATKGTYWVHNRCFRCHLYRKELRHAVAFIPKEI